MRMNVSTSLVIFLNIHRCRFQPECIQLLDWTTGREHSEWASTGRPLEHLSAAATPEDLLQLFALSGPLQQRRSQVELPEDAAEAPQVHRGRVAALQKHFGRTVPQCHHLKSPTEYSRTYISGPSVPYVGQLQLETAIFPVSVPLIEGSL